MKWKNIAGAILIVIGSILTFKGAIETNQSLINAGIGGVFLGVVVLTFSTSDYVKYDAFKAVVLPYFELVKNMIDSLDLKSKAVYIPPYSNLPDGGVFIPLHKDFDIDLAKLDKNTMFIVDVGREKEMGLLITPLGKELVKMYESYSELDFTNAGLHIVENASAVLRSFDSLFLSFVIDSSLVSNFCIRVNVLLLKLFIQSAIFSFCSFSILFLSLSLSDKFFLFWETLSAIIFLLIV